MARRPDTRPLPHERRINQLGLKTAALTAAATAVVALAVLLVAGRWAWVAAPLVGLLAGAAAYTAVHTLVARRLELARATLRQARKRRFEALARLQIDRGRDELDELLWQVYRAGRVLQKEIERLERLETHRRDFLGNVSHELKTPIFVIAGFAEQLLDGALEDERVNRRFIEKIGKNAQRLDLLARDLLAISRIESGELRMATAPFALAPLVEEVIEGLESVAEAKEVTLLQHVPEELPPVIGDRDRLRQVLVNLVDNAIKYNNPGGRVEVAARLTAQKGPPAVRVAVVDDGIGIPPEAVPRLTERFYRVDRSRSRSQGGTGLGLAIVKHILEAHGQRLRIESRAGYGSSFSFDLRAEAPAARGDGVDAAAPLSAALPGPAGVGETVGDSAI
ncbi:MAG: ATP-binding protein [Rhodothermales bacterium]|nr:ATP-binding protein [Rhodothermales bacterium]